MATIRNIIGAIKEESSYKGKAQLLNYLYNVITSTAIGADDQEAIGELFLTLANDIMRDARPDRPYRENCEIISCQNAVMGIAMRVWPNVSRMPLELTEAMHAMLGVMNKIRELEMYVEEVCSESKIDARVAGELTERLRAETDSFKLYDALLTFLQSTEKGVHITDEAVAIISEYLFDALKNTVAKAMSEDEISLAELLADAVGSYPTSATAELLHSIISLGINRISYFAIISIMRLEGSPSKEEVEHLARDEQYANSTYRALEKYGLTALFPIELQDDVYLAKSDLINWLTYPTELGEKPEKIEYLGEALPLLSKKPSYRIFRFTSSSETLDEDSKNVWLIGWSSVDGGTFSGFDHYADFEGKNTKETLTRVAKKLIGIALPRIKV